MSQEPIVTPKFKELSFDEIKKLVLQSMDDKETLLLQKESNIELLDNLIREHRGNSLAQDTDAPIVITNIIQRMVKAALSGEIKKFIYLGSRDFHSNKKENASAHSVLMLRLTEDMKIDDKDAEGKKIRATEKFNVWNSTPNKRTSDIWEPGYSYDCSIRKQPDSKGKIDEITGKIIIYENIKDFRVIDSAKEVLAKYLLTIPSSHEFFKQFTSGVDAELAKVLLPQMQYKPATLEYTITDVSGLHVSQRVLRGESYEWETPKDAPLHPVIKANNDNKPQIVFNVAGETLLFSDEELKKPEAERKPMFTFVIYGTFNAAELAQYFIASPTLEAMFENPTFMAESPSNQVDHVAMQLRGKRFRITGDMQNINFSEEGNRIILNIAGIALVEVPPA